MKSKTRINSTPEKHLDDSQARFCAMGDASVRLLAPAGSGKTHSLLHRCKALAEQSEKTKPRILVFTFTRGARDVLRDRIKSDISFREVAPCINISTLNSWGNKYVKENKTNLKLINKESDKKFHIQHTLRTIWRKYPAIESLLDDMRRRDKASRDLADLIDGLKAMGFRHDTLLSFNAFTTHIEYLVDCGMQLHMDKFYRDISSMDIIKGKSDLASQAFEKFIPFWREACDMLYGSGFITLDDQKYWARIFLENKLEEGRFTTGTGRYHHIFVDEFQDINPLDLALLKAIGSINKAKLTIVGDDDQAIFEWRGATPEFILEPEHYLGEKYETCILTTNYRSPRNIVELSQKLIVHNERRVPKTVKAYQALEALVKILRYSSISQAIDGTVELVESLLNDEQCKNIALISRKRSQIIPYQIIFAKKKIPFYAAEDLQIFLSDAFTDMKNILGICGRESKTRKFGFDTIDAFLKLCDKVKRYPLSKKEREPLRRYLNASQPSNLREAAVALANYTGSLKGGSKPFADAIFNLVVAKTVSESIQAIGNNFEGLQKNYGKALEDIFYTDPPFLYLSDFAERYGNNYAAFYSDIEMAIDTLVIITDDEEDAEKYKEPEKHKEPEWKRPLHLMTALRAKGKEFDAVIILDANDGVWPNRLAKDEQLEQERRLFYVAITRARGYLYFTLNDRILGKGSLPSPYLAEMGLSIPETIRGSL